MVSEDITRDGEAFYSACRAEAVALATALTGLPMVAEDIAQESLLKTIQRLADIDNPEAYLRTVVLNGCRSWHRSMSRENARVRGIARMAVDVSDDSREMLLLLDGLPFRHRAALQLRFWGGWTDEEIADALGCKTASVRVFVHRGLARLRQHITAEEAT